MYQNLQTQIQKWDQVCWCFIESMSNSENISPMWSEDSKMEIVSQLSFTSSLVTLLCVKLTKNNQQMCGWGIHFRHYSGHTSSTARPSWIFSSLSIWFHIFRCGLLRIRQNPDLSDFLQMPSSLCSVDCHPGFRIFYHEGIAACCFDCVPCPENEVSNKTGK